jgi:amidase
MIEHMFDQSQESQLGSEYFSFMQNAVVDGVELARLVQQGKASPTELLEEAIARADAINPKLNAIIHRLDEQARSVAADMSKQKTSEQATLRGVPFLTKDLTVMTKGDPYHAGNVALRDSDFRAGHTTHLATMFQQLGLVNFGRTNTPEFGGTVTTEPISHGACRNPWNIDHSTGGSSGGSAAAVAAGIVPIAHANDGGGSIRIPASECGLVGLKPSKGRVSFGPKLGEAWAGAAIDGVVTRTIRDTARVLDGISQPWIGDPYWAPLPATSFEQAISDVPRQLRVGLVTESSWGTVHPECIMAAEQTALALQDLGHLVEVAKPDALFDDDLFEHFKVVLASSEAFSVEKLQDAVGRRFETGDMEADTQALVELGRKYSATDYLASVEWFHSYTRQMASWWQEFDLLLTPVIAEPPPKIGELRDPRTGTKRLRELLLFTAQFNITGQPAISLPMHTSKEGLPIGVQLVAAMHGESLLLQVGQQLEDASSWYNRKPAVWVA